LKEQSRSIHPVVKFRDIAFRYDDDLILKEVSFDVAEREFLGVIGPNGGGKTTLLRLIMGFLEPYRGSISVFESTPAQSRDRVGYVPQNLKYDKEFPISVLELTLLGLLSNLPWYGRFSKEDKRKAEEALERLGIGHLKHRALGSLSGGQAQRALIARALVSNPKLLLLDEPTANVDPQAEKEIYTLLKELSRDVTVMMVTHDLHTAIEYVDRVLLVQQTVEAMKAQEVCEHFAMGLYHKPLLVEEDSNDLCCQRQVHKKESDES
jgi:zinc transport system ATP-binding protein